MLFSNGLTPWSTKKSASNINQVKIMNISPMISNKVWEDKFVVGYSLLKLTPRRRKKTVNLFYETPKAVKYSKK